jgi:hypothetical protein
MSAEMKNTPTKFLEQFTATKDRPKEFQMVVLVMVLFAVVCALVSLILIAFSQ